MSNAPALPSSFRLVRLGTVESTNEEARRLAGTGAEAGTLVWADRQSGGRGRRGRTWVSPPGNLYCSLLLRPNRTAAEAVQVSFVAAVALAEAVAALLPVDRRVSCKWPNDVLVDRRKISGILLESRMSQGGGHAAPGRMEWLVLGVGVNVASFPPLGQDPAAYPAISLHAAGGVASVEEVIEVTIARLAHWLARWESAGFAPVRQAWLRWAEGLGARVVVRLADTTMAGIFAALDDSGALVLVLDDGTRRLVTAGDVFPAE